MSQGDAEEFISWAQAARLRTSFDLNIFGYPRCAMLMTENGKGRLAYLPVQTVLMAECFIPRPESTNRQKAASLGLFDKSLRALAVGMSVGDVYTYIPDAEEDYIKKVIHHKWLEIPDVRLFKKSTGVSVAEAT